MMPRWFVIMFFRRGGMVEWNGRMQVGVLALGVQMLHVHFLFSFLESASSSLTVVGR